MSLITEAKRKACYAAIDEYVSANTRVIGIGSGSTVVFCVERLKQLVDGGLKIDACIPTSFQARQLIMAANLPLGELNTYPELDVAFDGADEVDHNLNCIKGGGGCHVQERLVAYNARKFVIVADDRKDSSVLGTTWNKGVPIEVLPMVYVPVMAKVEAIGGTPVLRMCEGGKAGPIVTDNGNFIVDAGFGQIHDPATIDTEIRKIAGVVDTGLFIGMAEKVFFGRQDGYDRFIFLNGAINQTFFEARCPLGLSFKYESLKINSRLISTTAINFARTAPTKKGSLNLKKLTGNFNIDGLSRYDVDFLETVSWTKNLMEKMKHDLKVLQTQAEEAAEKHAYAPSEVNSVCFQNHELLTYDFSRPVPETESDLLHCRISTLNLTPEQKTRLIVLSGSAYNPNKDVVTLKLSDDEATMKKFPFVRRAKLLLSLEQLINESKSVIENKSLADVAQNARRPKRGGMEFPEKWKRSESQANQISAFDTLFQ
ncbi:hypothetical protein HK096_003670 [Nowakowskiella sp. JEL0078]|nr:hypothetical protein HK096_003670 [Nowakowskiella sp. JEL0078]